VRSPGTGLGPAITHTRRCAAAGIAAPQRVRLPRAQLQWPSSQAAQPALAHTCSAHLRTAAHTRGSTPPEKIPRLVLLQMRFLVALCYVMEATAISFDVTYNIIGATDVPVHDSPYWGLVEDKSDPFVAIFVNGRQVGLTEYRDNDPNPIWQKRISFRLDRTNDEVCIYLFDRDTFDGSDAGANLEQMKTRNQWILYRCNRPASQFYLCGGSYLCQDISLTDQTIQGDNTGVAVSYDVEIKQIFPPSPPPPPYPSPPTPTQDMGEKAKDATKDVVDSMPGWLVAILISVGSVCVLGCFCKYCCLDDDDRPSRSSVPAVPVSTQSTSAHSSSSPSSASGLQWNLWAALDRVLARTTHSAQNPGDSVLGASLRAYELFVLPAGAQKGDSGLPVEPQ
jgi:hypothetical protein